MDENIAPIGDEEVTAVANLNSLVEDDPFAEAASDDKEILITQPELNDRPLVDETNVVDDHINNDVVSNSRLFDGITVDNQLPKVDAQFEIQADRALQLPEILRLQSAIRDGGAISQESIMQIESIAPGFINAENPINQYTETPTKVHLEEGLQDIDTYLEKQYDDIRTSINELAEAYIKVNGHLPDAVNKRYYDCISMYNKTYAQLLYHSGKDEIAQIGMYLNNGMKLHTYLSEFNCCEGDIDSTLNVAKDTFIYPYMKEFWDIMRAFNYSTYDYALMESIPKPHLKMPGELYDLEGDKLCICKRQYNYGDPNDPTDYHKNYSVESLIYSLLGNKFRSIIAGLIRIARANMARITDATKTSAEVQASSEHISMKIKDLTVISSTINTHVRENQIIFRWLDMTFSVYDLFIRLLEDLLKKVKPVNPTPVVTE